jgi:hypothetical protein
MKLNVMFTIAAVYGFLIGLSSLLVPGTMAEAGGLQASSGLLMMVRFVGVEALGLGLIAWLVRNADASKTRDGVVLGFTIYFALHALTSLYGQFTDLSETARHDAWIADFKAELLAAGCGSGAYVNFLGTDDEAALNAAYQPATLARLAEVKRLYDPGNFFRSNLNVQPAPVKL